MENPYLLYGILGKKSRITCEFILQKRQYLLKIQLLTFTTTARFVLNFTSIYITLTNHQPMWNTNQFHIRKHHTCTFFTIIH